MSWDRIRLLVWREWAWVVLQRSFLMTHLALPLFALGIAVVVGAGTGALVSTFEPELPGLPRVALVDEPGVLERIRPQLEDVELVEVLERADPEALDDRVRSRSIDAWVHLRADEGTTSSVEVHGLWRAPAVQRVFRQALLERMLRDDLGEARAQHLLDGDWIRRVEVAGTAPDRDEALHDLSIGADIPAGAFAMVLVVLFAPLSITGRLAKESQMGLVDLLHCALSPVELVIGKSLAALAITASTILLWLALPAVGLLLLLGVGAQLIQEPSTQLLELLPEFGEHAGWWLLLTSAHATAFVFVAAAAGISLPEDGLGKTLGGLITMVPIAGLATTQPLMILASIQPDAPLVVASSMVPVIGASLMYIRIGTAPAWQPWLSIGLAMAGGLLLATLLVRVGRAATVLGAWPRSLEDLRRAWEIA